MYQGYLILQRASVEAYRREESLRIPETIDYDR
jgi:tRNA U34 5-carboxymethylaminomethyl modifying enzyme MnmG/GidA